MDFARDLERVFYGPPFAFPFLRVRPAVVSREVWLIVGIEDEEALEGRAMAAHRTARFIAGKDVHSGDQLVAVRDVQPGIPAGTTFRVLDEPRRVVDGMEMEALLGSVKTT